MRRRELFPLVAGAVLATNPQMANARQPPEVARLGFLGLGTAASWSNRVEALRTGLRDLGYVEGKNLVIEFRWAGTVEQLQEAANELARIKVDVIFATSSTEVERAKRATKTIPIVFATHADPVGLGHVDSLPRPGGNITGLSYLVPEITAKQVEILKETAPQVTRLGVLWSPTAPSHRPILAAARAASGILHIQLTEAAVEAVGDFEKAFAAVALERVDALLVAASSLTRTAKTLLAELALKHRLPAMFGVRENVDAGGLMSYAADLVDSTRRSAVYIDKILKSAKPADLPVEQASKYQLIINLKTAAALGLTIPPPILARADELID